MTRALVTQLVDALESGIAYVENEANQLTTREYKTAITAARGYLATEPSGERAELIADLRELIDLHAFAKDVVDRAAHLLEADAQQTKRVPMTNEEIDEIGVDYSGNFQVLRDFARAIEAHHGITPAEKPTDWSAA